MKITARRNFITPVILAMALSLSATATVHAAEDMMENMSKQMDMNMDKDMDMAKDMDMPQKSTMKMSGPEDAPTVPPVAGYSEGDRISFLHTEASDQDIAKLLSDMMGSPVIYVPSLALAPAEMLATVFVFANGIKPEDAMGPLEFQPDVFDSPPGQPGYSPLRRIVFVRWNDSATPRILTTADEVARAVAEGQISLEATDIVVNMPMLEWPGGRR